MKRLLVGLITVGLWGQVPSVLFEREPPPRVPANQISAQVTGAGGTQTYYYWVVATYPVGDAVPGGPVQVNDVADNLGVGNFVTVSWPLMPGALTYDVLRTTTPQYPSGVANVLVAGAVAGPAQVDNTNVVGAYTPASTARADGFLRLNNQAYAQPEFEMQPGLNIFGNLTVTGTILGTFGGFTPGSTLFAGALGQITEDNASYFWDDANNRLGVGTNAPLATFHASDAMPVLANATTQFDPHVVSAMDAAIDVIASGTDGGAWDASLTLGIVNDATGALINKWGLVRQTTTYDLFLTFGVARSASTNLPMMVWEDEGHTGVGRGNIDPSGTLDVLDRTAVTGATLLQVGWDGTNPSVVSTQMIIADGTAQANVSQVLFTDNAGANPVGIDRNAAGILEVNDGVANTITGDLAFEHWFGTAVAFAALGAPANGTFVYCNDCTIANPCAAAGNGALAKRLNGVWVCN